MKSLLILFIFNSFALASLVETYRISNIESVEKQIVKMLQTKKYWSDYLKNYDLKYGFYQTVNSIILCSKKNKTLTLYTKKDNKFVKSLKSSILVGGKAGDKQSEGDLRTPSGVYTFKSLLTKKDSDLDSFYGPLAIVTSYPNLYDKVQQKTGSGIWIHGLPTDQKRETFTQGCIALKNHKLVELKSKINYQKSILLTSYKTYPRATNEQISTILAQIYRWKFSWQFGYIDKYLSFYTESFTKKDGMNLEDFAKRKRRIFKNSVNKSIKFSNINITPYINDNNELLFRVFMKEDYKSKNYNFNGYKELYIRLNPNETISILTES
jgi:murein L,D-transpeptidase YafK